MAVKLGINPEVVYVPAGGTLPAGRWRIQSYTGAFPVLYYTGASEGDIGQLYGLVTIPGRDDRLPGGAKLLAGEGPILCVADGALAPWGAIESPEMFAFQSSQPYLSADLKTFSDDQFGGQKGGVFFPTRNWRMVIAGGVPAWGGPCYPSIIGTLIDPSEYTPAPVGTPIKGVYNNGDTLGSTFDLGDPNARLVIVGGDRLAEVTVSATLHHITVPGPFRVGFNFGGDPTGSFLTVSAAGLAGSDASWR